MLKHVPPFLQGTSRHSLTSEKDLISSLKQKQTNKIAEITGIQGKLCRNLAMLVNDLGKLNNTVSLNSLYVTVYGSYQFHTVAPPSLVCRDTSLLLVSHDKPHCFRKDTGYRYSHLK